MYISLDVFFSSLLLLSSHVSLCEVVLHLCIQFLRAGSKERSVNPVHDDWHALVCTNMCAYILLELHLIHNSASTASPV